ncbi:MAG TPA: cellulase family glycosylhydrolase, partial [Solirubrobacteraceae bacterium]
MLRRSRTLLAVCAAAVAALAGAPAAQAVEPGLVTDLSWGTPAADQDRTAGLISDLGARWVRVEINWREAEPAPGQYHAWSFEQYDRAVKLARDAGAKVVIMVGKSPEWASGSADAGTPPRDPADYARFVGHVAERYADAGVAAYEVWNEQNLRRFWSTGPDAAAYVKLLAAAHGSIKAADPRASVVFGGLSTNDYAYVEAAYAAGAARYFDVMAVHPYTCGVAPGRPARRGDGRISPTSFLGYREVRASMAARGDAAKPIWFTEFGWSTTSAECGVSEATQAAYVKEALDLTAGDAYVGAALYYNARNNYWDKDSDTYEAQFGLVRTDFSPKPAYGALKAWARGSAAVSAGSTAAGAAAGATGSPASVAAAGDAADSAAGAAAGAIALRVVVGPRAATASAARATRAVRARGKARGGASIRLDLYAGRR